MYNKNNKEILENLDTRMADIQKHRIAAAKFEYEYLGKSPQEIALAYDFPLVSLESEVRQQEWSRKIEPTELPDTKDMQDFAGQLEKITRSKLSIISLFRQIEQQPLLAEIEKAMLGKILEFTASLDSMDDKCANKLLNLAKAIEAIQARNPIDLADSFKDAIASQGSGIVVNIANQIQ